MMREYWSLKHIELQFTLSHISMRHALTSYIHLYPTPTGDLQRSDLLVTSVSTFST